MEKERVIYIIKVKKEEELTNISLKESKKAKKERQKRHQKLYNSNPVLQIKKLSFSYQNNKVLSCISFNLYKGETLGLVGESGSGKSTIVSLLQRFYDTSEGTITIDGYDLTTLDLRWLRQHIGYVQQEPNLFGLTIRENMLYGVEGEISQEELEAASRDANAHDFIVEMPEG